MVSYFQTAMNVPEQTILHPKAGAVEIVFLIIDITFVQKVKS